MQRPPPDTASILLLILFCAPVFAVDDAGVPAAVADAGVPAPAAPSPRASIISDLSVGPGRDRDVVLSGLHAIESKLAACRSFASAFQVAEAMFAIQPNGMVLDVKVSAESGVASCLRGALSAALFTEATTRQVVTARLALAPAVVLGSLDKTSIRRTVQEHANQVRACYERELEKTPGIAGKIVMKWVIGGDGKVTKVETAETAMKNAAVEACLAAAISTWKFPAPKGGGIVIVNYPFVFRQSG